MSAAPSLHEIAAMPFPSSMLAMRKHYNPNWHEPEEEGEVRAYHVHVRYSVRLRESKTYAVEAVSESDAQRKAEQLFDSDTTIPYDADHDLEIDDLDAEQVA